MLGNKILIIHVDQTHFLEEINDMIECHLADWDDSIEEVPEVKLDAHTWFLSIIKELKGEI